MPDIPVATRPKEKLLRMNRFSLDSQQFSKRTANSCMLFQDDSRLLMLKTIPSLDAILAGEAQEPFSLSRFRKHLIHYHCSETLDFLLALNRYVRAYKDGRNIPEINAMWSNIIAKFVVADSLKEVNLSFEIREKLLIAEKPVSPEVLRDAIHLCQEMLQENSHATFIQDQLHVHF
jgi:hypothetical protein